MICVTGKFVAIALLKLCLWFQKRLSKNKSHILHEKRRKKTIVNHPPLQWIRLSRSTILPAVLHHAKPAPIRSLFPFIQSYVLKHPLQSFSLFFFEKTNRKQKQPFSLAALSPAALPLPPPKIRFAVTRCSKQYNTIPFACLRRFSSHEIYIRSIAL